MRFAGSESFAASRADVWSFLIDPARLSPCSPAPITHLDDHRYQAQARIGSGLFSATLVVDLEVVEIQALESASIVARGGASGTMVNATLTFTLRDGTEDHQGAEATIVDWDLEVTMAGMFAAAGLKAIGERAPQAIQDLGACVRQLVEA